MQAWPFSLNHNYPPQQISRSKGLTRSAHVWESPAETATAVLPSPRSTEGRFAPISARRGKEQA